MPENVRIPTELYILMTGYILDHYDETDVIRFNKIQSGIEQKKAAMIRRGFYTIYRTSRDSSIREIARREYLDRAEISPAFRMDQKE